VRIIAATAAVLEDEIQLGRFRQDLFYRLNVLPVHIPPLRRRREDIPALCLHFMKKYNDKLGCNVNSIKPSAMDRFLRYRWPGNVRQLENVIQRCLVLADEQSIEKEHLPQALIDENGTDFDDGIDWQGFSLKDAQKQLEAKFIKKALVETGGNKSKAAALLEISYPSLLSKIKEYCQ
jgi:two-component system response regulator AtoC